MRKNRSTAALSVGMYCRAGCTEIPSREHTPAEALASLGSNPDPKRVRNATRLLRSDDPARSLLLPIALLAVHLDAEQPPTDYARRRNLDYDSLLPDPQWETLWFTLCWPVSRRVK